MDTVEHREMNTETADVIARPPLLFLAALALGFIADHLLPLPFPIARPGTAHWLSAFLASSMVVIGLAVAGAGIRSFTRAGTPVPGNQPVRALVTTGIHGWSRNPIYVGMLLLYLGIGLLVRSPWILLLALPLAITIRFGVIAREEAYLERRFGNDYQAYRARVRRWI